MYGPIDFTTPSCETTVRQVEQFIAVADHIPVGSPINVAFVEDLPTADRLAGIRALTAAGLRVRPILSARRIRSEAQLGELIRGITDDLAIRELLIVGGDPTEPAGPYATARELIRSSPITDSSIELIGLPGFPKEHPTTPPHILLEHLVEKVQAIEATGRDVEITTQLCLDPHAVHAWLTNVRAHGIAAPIRIGVPAPATASRLVRFCQLCKVDATIQQLRRFGWVGDTNTTIAHPAAFLRTLSQLLQSGSGTILAHIYPMSDLRAAFSWFLSLSED